VLLNNLIKRIIWQFSYATACDSTLAASFMADTTSFSNSPVIAHKVIDTSRHIKTHKTVVYSKDFTKQPEIGSDTLQTANDTINKMGSDTGSVTSDLKMIEIKIYPNPTTGMIYIKMNGRLNELYLTDVSGKLISRIETKGKPNAEINMEEYTAGIYFLKFEDGGKWFSGKILLMH
jgi:hypothetical protein